MSYHVLKELNNYYRNKLLYKLWYCNIYQNLKLFYLGLHYIKLLYFYLFFIYIIIIFSSIKYKFIISYLKYIYD